MYTHIYMYISACTDKIFHAQICVQSSVWANACIHVYTCMNVFVHVSRFVYIDYIDIQATYINTCKYTTKLPRKHTWYGTWCTHTQTSKRWRHSVCCGSDRQGVRWRKVLPTSYPAYSMRYTLKKRCIFCQTDRQIRGGKGEWSPARRLDAVGRCCRINEMHVQMDHVFQSVAHGSSICTIFNYTRCHSIVGASRTCRCSTTASRGPQIYSQKYFSSLSPSSFLPFARQICTLK